MTGFLGRLAARGAAGGDSSGDAAPMTAPLRPRFASDLPAEPVEPTAETASERPDTPEPASHSREPAGTTHQRVEVRSLPAANPSENRPEITRQPQQDQPVSRRPEPKQAAPETEIAAPQEGGEPIPAPRRNETFDKDPRPTAPKPVTDASQTTTVVDTGAEVPVAVASLERAVRTEIIERQTPVGTDDMQAAQPLEPPEVTTSGQPAPVPTLSIGRIDVVFEQPPAPPPLTQIRRPEPDRTRGFGSYAARRMGRRR